MCEDLILSSSRASPLPHVLMSFLVVICKCVNVCVLCMQICMYMVRVCARARVSVYPFAVFVGVVSWCHTQTQYCVCVYARAYKYILCACMRTRVPARVLTRRKRPVLRARCAINQHWSPTSWEAASR